MSGWDFGEDALRRATMCVQKPGGAERPGTLKMTRSLGVARV